MSQAPSQPTSRMNGRRTSCPSELQKECSVPMPSGSMRKRKFNLWNGEVTRNREHDGFSFGMFHQQRSTISCKRRFLSSRNTGAFSTSALTPTSPNGGALENDASPFLGQIEQIMWEDRRLREITERDLRQLIDAQLEEHLQLEYKGALYEANDQGNKESLLDICM